MSEQPRLLSLLAIILGILACACLLVCFIIYPINGYDAPLHLNWLSQFTNLYREGYTDLKWLPDSYLGFGAPVFYFYPPLVYWSAGIVSLFGVTNSIALYQIVSGIFLIASGFSAYWFFKNIFTSHPAALWSSVIYCSFLYRFVDLYERNAFSEHAAFVFIPIVLLSLWLFWKNEHSDRYKIIFVTAIGWAGLALSNIPATIILFYILIIFIIAAKIYNRHYTKFIMRYAIGAIFAFCIAAVYVLPASELSEALSNKYLSPFQFEDGASLSGFFAIDLWHDLTNKTFYISLAIVTAFGIVAAILLYKDRKLGVGNRPILRLVFIGLVVSILFQLPYLFILLWKILPGFDLLQFSWRWDIWITLAIAMIVGLAIEHTRIKTASWLVAVSSIATMAIAGYFYFSIAKREPVSSQNILSRGQEYLPSSATATAESITKIIERRKRDPEIQVVRGSAWVNRVRREPTATFFEASSSANSELQFKRFYFPTWHLRDDRGVEYPLRSDSIGRIIATIGEGRRGYRLSIVKTNEEQIGTWLSVFGIGGLAALALVTRLSRKRAASTPLP